MGLSRPDVPELGELARRKRRETVLAFPRRPGKDGWMGPVFPGHSAGTLLHNLRWWFFPCKQGGMPSFKYDGAIDQWRKTVVIFSSCSAMTLWARLSLIGKLRGCRSHSRSATFKRRGGHGRGHGRQMPAEHDLYRRGPEMPKGKGRRRERDRERAQMFGLARDPMHRTGPTESAAAPGVEPEVRDPAGLMGVKSTNSPDRVEIPPNST